MQNELSVGDIVQIVNYDEEYYEGKYARIDNVPSRLDSYYYVTLIGTDWRGPFLRKELELVLPYAPAVPECPFPMGSMVNDSAWLWKKAYKVIGWEKIDNQWCVTLDDGKGAPARGYLPDNLVLVPEPEEPAFGTPILWEGKWYAKPSSRTDYYFSLTDWSWMGNVTWDKMKATATVPGP